MENKKIVMGWISFGLGIATWILLFFSMLLSPAALILGILSLVKEGRHWSSIVGICLSGASLLTMLFGMIFFASLL